MRDVEKTHVYPGSLHPAGCWGRRDPGNPQYVFYLIRNDIGFDNIVCNQFVNRATNSDAFLVGSSLHSCTSEVQLSPRFLVDGNPVVLIDTPGFNDTTVEDAEVLEDIAAFLATMCVISPFHIVLLTRVSDMRAK